MPTEGCVACLHCVQDWVLNPLLGSAPGWHAAAFANTSNCRLHSSGKEEFS